MAFDVMDIDLTQLFKNDDTYTIPRYQRNYVWNICYLETYIRLKQ